jgi:hypothetical protein
MQYCEDCINIYTNGHDDLTAARCRAFPDTESLDTGNHLVSRKFKTDPNGEFCSIVRKMQGYTENCTGFKPRKPVEPASFD